MTVAQLSGLFPLAKAYQWECNIGGIGILAESCSIPSMSGQTIDVMLRGALAKDVGIYRSNPIDITFLEDGRVGPFLYDWLNQQYDPKTGCGSKTTKDVSITLGGCGFSGYTWQLEGAFPVSVNGSGLTSDGGSLFQISVSLEYDYVTVG